MSDHHRSRLVSLANARRFVRDTPMDELDDWKPCGVDGCIYCAEVRRCIEVRREMPS